MQPRELMDKIIYAKKMAALDIEEVPAKTRPGMQIAKRQAQNELAGLREVFSEYLHKSALAVFVSGKYANDFVSLANQEDPDILHVDLDDVYRRIADVVEPSMRQDREISPTQFSLMLGEYGAIGKSIGLTSMPALKYRQDTPRTKEALVTFIKNVVRESVGDELAIDTFRKNLLEKAESREYSRSVIPVLVTGATSVEEEQAVNKTCTKGSFSFTIEEEPTKETVDEAFDKIKQTLTTPKKEKQQKVK